MRKLIFGAGALLLMSSLISCRDAETNTTAEAENSVEQPVSKEESETFESAVEADSLEVKEEIQNDSLPVSEAEIK